jgi:RimJ/RimL family protein N-acetyltransferase
MVHETSIKENCQNKYFLEGKSIYLRKVRLSDVDGDYHAWMNDPQITKFLECRFFSNSRASLKEYVQEKSKSRDSVFLAIVLKKSQKHIGNIKLDFILNRVHRLGDIGIVIGSKAHWGKGYASEAISLISNYAFNTSNLHKLTACCYSSNYGSIRIFEKNGYEIEGTLKKHFLCDGQFVDAVVLGLVNPGK